MAKTVVYISKGEELKQLDLRLTLGGRVAFNLFGILYTYSIPSKRITTKGNSLLIQLEMNNTQFLFVDYFNSVFDKFIDIVREMGFSRELSATGEVTLKCSLNLMTDTLTVSRNLQQLFKKD